MEYIICQKEAKGTLIVSEFTGVSAALGRAIKVNPWDLGVSLSFSSPSRVGAVSYGSLLENEERSLTSHSCIVGSGSCY